MLLAGSRLIDAPVMGLQTGSELARTSQAIIDPRTLQIIAYELTGPLLAQQPSFLRIADVREFSDIGLIIDSADEFVTSGDIIRLDEVYKFHFNPTAMSVIDEKHHKLGKVDDYTIETGNFVIQQLTVRKPILKSLNESHLLVHRTQIKEINDTQIIVQSTAKIVEPALQHSRAGAYVNPFRKTPQPEHRD